MTGKHALIPLILVLLVACVSASDSIQIEMPTQGDDEFLTAQDFTFITCTDDTDEISTYLICAENYRRTYLDEVRWNSSCFVSVYNPYSIDCDALSVVSEFRRDGKIQTISKSFDTKKAIINPLNVLNKQEWDGGFGDAVNTSIAIWLLSDFKDKYSNEIDNAMDWLKRNRNNAEKCWPEENCGTETTIEVLSYLSLAGFNETNRILFDARVWVERHQNYIKDTAWNTTLSSNEETTCNFTFDNSVAEYTLNETHSEDIDLTVDYGKYFNFSCDETATMTLRDSEGFIVLNRRSSADIEYTLPEGACWSRSQWNGCNNRITIFALLANLTSVREEETETYLSDELSDDDYIGQYISTGDPIQDNALYYTYVDSPVAVARYLVFQQNNNGSFGEGSNVEVAKRTMRVINALEKTNLSFAQEAIIDARDWVELTSSPYGFHDILADSIAYYTMKNTNKSFLQSTPQLIEIHDEDVIVQLYNPTLFNYTNLSSSISTNLLPYISANVSGNMSYLSSMDVFFKKKILKAGTFSGFFNIYNNSGNSSTHLAKIPIVITEKPDLDIEVAKSTTVFGSNGVLPITLNRINGDFDCTAGFLDGPIQNTTFALKNGAKKHDLAVIMKEPQRLKKDYSGLITCVLENNTLSHEFTTTIDQYPKTIIEVSPSEVILTSRRDVPEITVTNLIDEGVNLKLGFEKGTIDQLVLGKTELKLGPSGSETFSLLNTFERTDNITRTDNIIVLTLDQKIPVPVSVEIIYTPFTKTIYFRIIMFLLLISMLVSGVYAIYYFRETIRDRFDNSINLVRRSSSTILDKAAKILPKKVRDMLHIKLEEEVSETENQEGIEQKEELKDYGAMIDLIKIMLSMNKEEKDIIERLRKEGMSDEDVKGAISVVHEELVDKEEIEKEESVIKVIKKMDEDSETIRTSLKGAGFSDTQINQAFEEIEGELQVKEKDLQEHLSKLRGGDEEEEASLVDIEKEKTGGEEEKEEKK